MPNLIVVGAADAAGGETGFSNHGKVDVFAEGFEVPSKAPGGSRILFSGTSAASPQVVNLAAKLLAVKPMLSVAELRRAILESAEEKTIGPGKTIRRDALLVCNTRPVQFPFSRTAWMIGSRVR